MKILLYLPKFIEKLDYVNSKGHTSFIGPYFIGQYRVKLKAASKDRFLAREKVSSLFASAP